MDTLQEVLLQILDEKRKYFWLNSRHFHFDENLVCSSFWSFSRNSWSSRKSVDMNPWQGRCSPLRNERGAWSISCML